MPKVVIGGNKVTIKTPLIATRYSLIIRWLSLSVILVALDLRKIIWFFSNFSTKPQFLYEGAIFLKKFNIKN